MSNLLEAIYNISNLIDLTVQDITFGNNRANNVGEGLETFVKDAFANTFSEEDKAKRLEAYAAVYSYQGSKRNPPDLMLRGGDAIEVKKTESLTTELQLNSSPPKAKLFANSSLITEHCKKCEDWAVKDFIYVIGHLPKKSKNKLSSLWFIDGSLYAADETVYTALKENLTTNIEAIPNVDFSPTNEIGRVNGVDPLKITNLRIRGMWLLHSPYKVFDYVHGYSPEEKFQCIALIPSEKYDSFPQESRTKVETSEKIKLTTVKVQNPNNPVHLMDCKLIKYTIGSTV
ncbi:NgoPII family restriction endonuclease [Aureispira anguillae]|uniref:NgoPII family restriction endonuclease n=1 Tax=Aureispira anguillae TaxID=2864201 RepID=A0A915YBH7_9BACT|nr:NgoPII family restriction endonuclease [Aureispira anguillae]BDS10021.1 NgoPII family restriction endonuclease [Aureispira anguillae]